MHRRFGEIWQLGYVVDDLDTAVDGWLAAGVGPWYVIGRFPVDHLEVRGVEAHPDISIALAYSGALQVELIHQHDDTPTPYLEFLTDTGGGLQHLGYLPDDYDAARRAASADGWTVVQEGTASGTRFVYLDAGNHLGTISELVDLDPGSASLFEHMRAESATWDGTTRPVRQVGPPR